MPVRWDTNTTKSFDERSQRLILPSLLQYSTWSQAAAAKVL